MPSRRTITAIALLLISLLLGGSQATAGPGLEQSEIPDVEYQALVALYHSMDGPNWTSNDGWLVTDTPCSWHGVYCGEGHVTGLYLYGNELTGAVPPELGNLAGLRLLYLSGNQLMGPLPPELGNLAGLQWLYLDHNPLSGPLPRSLMDLSLLDYFYFGDTGLCEPGDGPFQTWLSGINGVIGTGVICRAVHLPLALR